MLVLVPIHSRDMIISLMKRVLCDIRPRMPVLVTASVLAESSVGMWVGMGSPLERAATLMLFRALSVLPTDTSHLGNKGKEKSNKILCFDCLTLRLLEVRFMNSRVILTI